MIQISDRPIDKRYQSALYLRHNEEHSNSVNLENRTRQTGKLDLVRAEDESESTSSGPAVKSKEDNTMSTKEIENTIRELHNLQALIAEAEEEADTLKDQIKAIMGDSEELTAGEYRVSWKHVTSHRLDTTALKKALPDIAAAFTKETTSRRFVVA